MKHKGIITLLAVACGCLIFNNLLTSYKYGNDLRLLMAIQNCSPGLTQHEVEQVIHSSVTLSEYDAEYIESLTGQTLRLATVRYSSTKYMGTITSRLLVLLFDENKVLLYATWANT